MVSAAGGSRNHFYHRIKRFFADFYSEYADGGTGKHFRIPSVMMVSMDVDHLIRCRIECNLIVWKMGKLKITQHQRQRTSFILLISGSLQSCL